ncbi:MAG: hypothetical protein AAF804_14495, partial [Bacteroidota bacterium]
RSIPWNEIESILFDRRFREPPSLLILTLEGKKIRIPSDNLPKRVWKELLLDLKAVGVQVRLGHDFPYFDSLEKWQHDLE